MNENNYTSLEMSRKLVEAGIALETGLRWFEFKGEWHLLRPTTSLLDVCDNVPAPCMAELWRELPTFSIVEKRIEGKTEAWVIGQKRDPSVLYTNPCDALAGLLIWLKRDSYYFREAFRDTPPEIITLRMTEEIRTMKAPELISDPRNKHMEETK